MTFPTTPDNLPTSSANGTVSQDTHPDLHNKANAAVNAVEAFLKTSDPFPQYLTQTQADTRYLQLAGGTLSGLLTLSADPSTNLQAATKQYADTKITQAQGDARYAPLAGGGYLQLTGGTLSGNLLFSPDNSYDIGASGASRPRSVYATSSVVAGALITPGDVTAGTSYRFGSTSSAEQLYKTGAGQIRLIGAGLMYGGSLLADTDNAYDIGAAGSNRPRNLYLGGNLNVQGLTTLGTTVGTWPPPPHLLLVGPDANNGYTTGFQISLTSDNNDQTVLLLAAKDGAGGEYRPAKVWIIPNDVSYNETTLTCWSGMDKNSAQWLQYGSSGIRAGDSRSGGTSKSIRFWTGGTSEGSGQLRWSIDTTGNLIPAYDGATGGAVDIGGDASYPPGGGPLRVRRIYVSGAFIGPGAVPTGGTTGQVLQKNTATDYDTAWVTPAGGGGGLSLPLAQNLTFSPDNTYDIGATSATLRPRTVYAATSVVTPLVNASTTLSLSTVSTTRFQVNSSGHLIAFADNSYDLGQSGANRPRNLFLAGIAQLASYAQFSAIVKPANPASGSVRLYSKADNNLYMLSNSGVEVALGGGGGGLTLPLSQTLTFSPDNTYDIGAAGATRPRDVYVGGTVYAGALTSGVGNGIQFVVNGTTSAWQLTSGGHLVSNSDNTYDIGASGANRPRNLYLGGNFSTLGYVDSPLYANSAGVPLSLQPWGSNVVDVRNGVNAQQFLLYNTYTDASNYERLNVEWQANKVYVRAVNAGTGTLRALGLGGSEITFQLGGSDFWKIEGGTGNFKAVTDNTYDIGASGANRPRDLFLGRNLSVNGNVGIGQASSTSIGLVVNPASTSLSGATQSILNVLGTFSATATTSGSDVMIGLTTAAAAFTMVSGYALQVVAPVVGAGSAITTLYGIYVANQGKAGITNAYGVYILAQSGAVTTNIGLYNLGTSRLDGNVGVGTVPTAGDNLFVASTNAAVSATGLNLQPTFTGATTTARALYIGYSLSGSYTLPSYYGIMMSLASVSGTTITDFYGMRIFNSSGTRTNAYGIYLDAQSGATTNNVPLRIAGAAAPGATNSPIWISNTSTGVFMRVDNTLTTTVGAAGGAAAPPATPTEYIRISVNGTNRKIPCYADAA